MSFYYSQPGWTSGVFNGSTYNYLSIKPSTPTKPTFLLIHGFPSGPYSFKTLIPILKEKGYGVIAPEQLGYGKSDQPTTIADLSKRKISASLAAILDKENVPKVVVVGHDLGSPVAASFSKWHKDRTLALVLGALGYSRPSRGALNPDEFHKIVKPIFGYELFGYFPFFMNDPQAPKLIQGNMKTFLRTFINEGEPFKETVCTPGNLEKVLAKGGEPKAAPFVTDEHINTLNDYLVSGGIKGPLLWYNAQTDADEPVQELAQVGDRITVPTLFLGAAKDVVCVPALFADQAEVVDDLTSTVLDLGHWIFEEDAPGTSQEIFKFLDAKGI